MRPREEEKTQIGYSELTLISPDIVTTLLSATTSESSVLGGFTSTTQLECIRPLQKFRKLTFSAEILRYKDPSFENTAAAESSEGYISFKCCCRPFCSDNCFSDSFSSEVDVVVTPSFVVNCNNKKYNNSSEFK